jgi:ribonuclease HI
MGLHLLKGLNMKLTHPTILGSDSQAVIRALDNQWSHPSQYILDSIIQSAEDLHKKQDGIVNHVERTNTLAEGEIWKSRTKGIVDLQVHWVPGHVDFAPNDRADEEAKKAAQGDSSDAKSLPKFLRNSLPLSISALRQSYLNKQKKRWERRWKMSPRASHLRSINNSAPSKKYIRLVSGLDRRQTSLLFQLRTGHVGLNQHLFRICRSETPVCPNCQGIIVETVKHFLLECPHYQRERHMLKQKLRRNADSISFLLNNPTAVLPLLKFVHSTGRFKSHFRKNPEDRILTNAKRNADLRAKYKELDTAISATASNHPHGR